MSERRIEQPFDAEEAALAQRLRALSSGAPSARLDAAILAAARAPRPARPRPLWIAGFAAAASLVLVVGLLWRLPPEQRATSAPMPPPMPRAALREAEPSATPAPTTPAADALRDRADARPPPLPTMAPAPASVAPTATPEAAAGTRQRARAELDPAATEARQRPAAPARPIAAEAPAAAAREPLDEVTVSGTRLATPTAAAAAEAEAAQAPQQANAAPPAVFEDAAPMVIEAPPPAPPAPPAPMRQSQDAPGAPTAAPETARGRANATADATLNDEIEAIRNLQREGRQELARQRLRALIQRHPQWAVPDDLQSLRE